MNIALLLHYLPVSYRLNVEKIGERVKVSTSLKLSVLWKWESEVKTCLICCLFTRGVKCLFSSEYIGFSP